MEATGKWRVVYGIHRRTLTSRDSGQETFSDEGKARERYNEILNDYRPGNDRFGYVLWFAKIVNPEGQEIEHTNGQPYW